MNIVPREDQKMIMRNRKKSEYERFMSLFRWRKKDREVSKYDSPGAIRTKPLPHDGQGDCIAKRQVARAGPGLEKEPKSCP